jgi:hypothetical protein
MKIRLFYKLFVAFAVIGVLTAAIAQFLIERQIRSDLVLRVETEMASEAHIIALMPNADRPFGEGSRGFGSQQHRYGQPPQPF